jgi:hypothetical protein
MRLVATEDVPGKALAALEQELLLEFSTATENSRFFTKSLESPSWVRLVAELSWWQQGPAAAAALYVAELVKEAAKGTWKSKSKAVSATIAASNAVRRLVAKLSAFKTSLSPRTEVLLCLPEPDKVFGTQIQFSFDDAATSELAVALFVRYQPAVAQLIASHLAAGMHAPTGHFLELLPDARLCVRWFDATSLQREEVVLELSHTAG